jgi:CHAT domain-containing protein
VLRPGGEPAHIVVGAAETIDAACADFVAAIADDAGDEASHAALTKAGAAVRALVWAPVAARLDADVRRVVICPDAALAAVPFAALPGKVPGTTLVDELSIAYVFHPFDLVPPKDAPPSGVGALVVGGVDYEHADAGSKEAPLPARPAALASLDRAPAGGSFGPIPATRVEAEAVRDRLGKDATTLLLGPGATEARFREAVKGKRVVHVATHGFARTDLLAGLYDRKVKDAFLSADAERQLAVGHDPMLLSGLALAGANPREGGAGDDGILTALEASYLDLDGVDLVTLSACETARGTAESGEGVLGLVSAFQMAGARRVLASLWKVDDEATRRLMDGVYERMLRQEHPLAPADALREAALALRAWKDPTGNARFAAPRYWAAFVAYGG